MGSKVCDARYDSPVAANVFRPARFHVVGFFCLQEVMMKCKICLPICILNGLLVAAFAMGSWQVLHDRLFCGSEKAEGG